tara:strand:+ start:42945 stop:43991 length:1047 start_codon:yes stop_codon:yes gene_type:complete
MPLNEALHKKWLEVKKIQESLGSLLNIDIDFLELNDLIKEFSKDKIPSKEAQECFSRFVSKSKPIFGLKRSEHFNELLKTHHVKLKRITEIENEVVFKNVFSLLTKSELLYFEKDGLYVVVKKLSENKGDTYILDSVIKKYNHIMIKYSEAVESYRIGIYNTQKRTNTLSITDKSDMNDKYKNKVEILMKADDFNYYKGLEGFEIINNKKSLTTENKNVIAFDISVISEQPLDCKFFKLKNERNGKEYKVFWSKEPFFNIMKNRTTIFRVRSVLNPHSIHYSTILSKEEQLEEKENRESVKEFKKGLKVLGLETTEYGSDWAIVSGGSYELFLDSETLFENIELLLGN